MLTQLAPELLEISGCGTDSAAQLFITAGDNPAGPQRGGLGDARRRGTAMLRANSTYSRVKPHLVPGVTGSVARCRMR